MGLVGFRLESTFDVSQTDGEPFEPPTVQRLRRQRMSSAGVPQLLAGDDPTDAFDDMVKLIKDAGYSFALDVPGSRYLGDANGVTVKPCPPTPCTARSRSMTIRMNDASSRPVRRARPYESSRVLKRTNGF